VLHPSSLAWKLLRRSSVHTDSATGGSLCRLHDTPRIPAAPCHGLFANHRATGRALVRSRWPFRGPIRLNDILEPPVINYSLQTATSARCFPLHQEPSGCVVHGVPSAGGGAAFEFSCCTAANPQFFDHQPSVICCAQPNVIFAHEQSVRLRRRAPPRPNLHIAFPCPHRRAATS